MRKKLTRLLSAATVGLTSAALALVPAQPALAASCGEVLITGSSWADGNGVDVRHNGPDHGTGTSCAGNQEIYSLTASPPQWGGGWQCFELAARLYTTQGWSNGLQVAYAAQIYTNAASLGMTRMAQGAIEITSIVPGDLVISDQATSGHVSVVSSVDVPNNVVHTVEQNASPDGWADYAYNPATKRLTRGTYYNVTGVVHDPDNPLTSVPLSPPAGRLLQYVKPAGGGWSPAYDIVQGQSVKGAPSTVWALGPSVFVVGSEGPFVAVRRLAQRELERLSDHRPEYLGRRSGYCVRRWPTPSVCRGRPRGIATI